MQKNIMMAAILCTPFMYGMEQENKLETKQWSVAVDDYTQINLTKDYLCDAYSKIKVGIGVVGRNQQRFLESNSFDYKEQEIGHMYCYGDCKIYSYKNSIDDRFKKEIVGKEPLSETNIYAFTEPCVFIQENKQRLYCVSRKKPLPGAIVQPIFTQNIARMLSDEDKKIVGTHYYDDESGTYVQYEFSGDRAIVEASKDLKKCYKEIFKQTSVPKAGASIALPALGINIPDAASIAVASILKFIKKNEDSYGRIELVVETDAEFNRYKLSLMNHCGLLKPVLIFWFAHYKDSKSMLALLPHELARYIAELFYNINN